MSAASEPPASDLDDYHDEYYRRAEYITTVRNGVVLQLGLKRSPNDLEHTQHGQGAGERDETTSDDPAHSQDGVSLPHAQGTEWDTPDAVDRIRKKNSNIDEHMKFLELLLPRSAPSYTSAVSTCPVPSIGYHFEFKPPRT